MTTDQMDRIREKARAVEHNTDEIYGSGGAYAAEAYVAGANAYRTLTDAEWEQTREDVDRAVWDGELPMADAAMWALGFKREGE